MTITRLTIAIALLMACGATAQGPAVTWIYVWLNGRADWFTLGPTLKVTNKQLDVSLPPAKVRRYDVALVYDPAKNGWPLPAGATNLVVIVGGLRYSPSNYTIAAGVLVAKFSNMDPSLEVLIDYDE
jgi:hypothetical protein